MKIVFCGTPASAVPSLEALAMRRPEWEIVAVLTQPDRPAGRGRREMSSPVKIAALDLGLEVHTPHKLKEARAMLEALRPDVVAVVAYGHIFRRWLLELPPLGCVNVHFSILPRHRGVAPVTWAILDGDAETGVTTMLMDRGIDTGDALLEERTEILDNDTTASLTERLAGMGGPLLATTLEGLVGGTVKARAQSDVGATYARRLEKSDGRIDWTASADSIARRVRGLSPWPGAFTMFREQTLKIHEVAVPAADVGEAMVPGRLRLDGDRVRVGTGSGDLELRRVQRAGKAATEAGAWAHGVRLDESDVVGGEA